MLSRALLPAVIATATVLAVGLGVDPRPTTTAGDVPVLRAQQTDDADARADSDSEKDSAKDEDTGDESETQDTDTDGSEDGDTDTDTTEPAPPAPTPVQPCEPAGADSADPPTGAPADPTTGADSAADPPTGAPDLSATCPPPNTLPQPPSPEPVQPPDPDVSSDSTLAPEPLAPSAPDEPAASPKAEPAVGPQVYFSSDYENGFADWGTCQSTAVNGNCSELGGDQHSIKIIERPDAPQGRKAARFVVEDGDTVDFGGERAELSDDNAGATVREGNERWYQWSMRVAKDFPEPQGGWFIVMQWHSDHGSPPLAIDLSKGTVDIGGNGTDAPRKTIGPIRRGEWVDYVLHVKFSQDTDKGFVEAWENGVQTVARTERATMNSDENYLKEGIYRDESAAGKAEVDFDNLRVTGPPNQGEVQPKLRNLAREVIDRLPDVSRLLPDVSNLLPGLLGGSR